MRKSKWEIGTLFSLMEHAYGHLYFSSVDSLLQTYLFRVSGISGMEWWNRLLEWNTGMD